jgi:hypothetical protein
LTAGDRKADLIKKLFRSRDIAIVLDLKLKHGNLARLKSQVERAMLQIIKIYG